MLTINVEPKYPNITPVMRLEQTCIGQRLIADGPHCCNCPSAANGVPRLHSCTAAYESGFYQAPKAIEDTVYKPILASFLKGVAARWQQATHTPMYACSTPPQQQGIMGVCSSRALELCLGGGDLRALVWIAAYEKPSRILKMG